MVRKIGKVVIVSLWIGTVCAEQSVSLRLTNTQGKRIKNVVVGTPFMIRATVSGDTQDLARPTIKGVDQFGQRSTQVSSSVSMINGVTSVKKEHISIVSVDQEGTFTIGPAQIEVDGELIESQTVTFTVSTEDRSESSEQKEAFSTVEVNKTELYQGEPLECTLRFYYDNQSIRLEGIEKPAFKDFSSSGLEGPVTGKSVMKGEEYFYLEWKAKLYPNKAGNLLIPAIKSVYSTPGRTHSLFSAFSFGGGRQQEMLYSNAVKVQVKPLPDHTPPVTAVGTFTHYSLSLNSQEATQGEGIIVKLTVKGNGNVDQIKHPALQLPYGLSHYDGNSSLVSGGKQFEYVVQGINPGKYTIEPQEFIFFNQETKAYQTITSEEAQILIKKGVPQATVSQEQTEEHKSEPYEILKRLSIMTHGKWRNSYERVFSWLWFFLLALLPLFGFCFFALKKRRDDFLEKNAPLIRYRRAFTDARATYQNARKGNYDGQLYHMFITLFAARLKITRAEVSETLIEQTMRSLGFTEEEIIQWRLLFAQLAERAFSSHNIDDKNDKLFNDAAHWINELEKRL